MLLKHNFLGKRLSTMFTTERLLTCVKHIMCLSIPALVAEVYPHSIQILIDGSLYLVDCPCINSMCCHGRFLSRPLITPATLRPLAFMYSENMSLQISLSFPLEWTLVAPGQELNHVMHKTSVRLQTTLLCKSFLASISLKSFS